jgi:5'-methylthioadenosine phosphorylase
MALSNVPKVAFANVGGSGSWGYRFPEGVFGEDSPFQVRKLEGSLVYETPFGDSPPFGLYELTNRATGERRQFLRVWMHGSEPNRFQPTAGQSSAESPMRATERVFSVLERAETKWILIDASVGGINPLLDSWDLVIAHDFYDDMKSVPNFGQAGMISLRQPYCPHLRQRLFEAAGRHLPAYTALAQRIGGTPVYPKIVKRGIYVCPDGPWFESPAQIADYQRRGFDIVGKTVVPEVQFARKIGAHFGCINPVVNPAEGLADPDTGARYRWTIEDLFRIYDNYGPTISRMVLETIATIDLAAPGCACDALGRRERGRNYGQYLE